MALSEASVLETVPDAVVVADEHGRIHLFNPAAQRLFGYALAEIVNGDVARLFPDRETTQRRTGWKGWPSVPGQAEGRSFALEVRARRSNGETFPAWLSVGVAEDQGRPGYVATFRDLSVHKADANRLRSLETQLSALSRLALAGEVAAGMAHEINQPLSAIATYAQAAKRLMQSDSPDLRVLEDACQKIDEQAWRAGDVVRGIRELIRRPKPRVGLLDINSVVAEVMSLIEADAGMESISVTGEYARSLPAVRGDAMQLQAVLLSLVRNSIEAMRLSSLEEPRILIRTSLDDNGRVRVSVADRGPGVDEGLEDRIFDPFVTSDRHRLGIGLSMSHAAIKAHEGGLYYESNPGGGSVFIIDLPASDPGATP
jgi:two-component system sensor kinase FixL